MDEDKAEAVARLLVLTDMMDRRTHGLAMVPLYIAAIRDGGMQVVGQPEVVKDTGATMVWDGRYLPGLWLMNRAIATAIERAAQHGMVAVAIRRSHHIGCLAALVKQAPDRGFVAIIANSDPAGQRVNPSANSALANALPVPDEAPVTSASCLQWWNSLSGRVFAAAC